MQLPDDTIIKIVKFLELDDIADFIRTNSYISKLAPLFYSTIRKFEIEIGTPVRSLLKNCTGLKDVKINYIDPRDLSLLEALDLEKLDLEISMSEIKHEMKFPSMRELTLSRLESIKFIQAPKLEKLSFCEFDSMETFSILEPMNLKEISYYGGGADVDPAILARLPFVELPFDHGNVGNNIFLKRMHIENCTHEEAISLKNLKLTQLELKGYDLPFDYFAHMPIETLIVEQNILSNIQQINIMSIVELHLTEVIVENLEQLVNLTILRLNKCTWKSLRGNIRDLEIFSSDKLGEIKELKLKKLKITHCRLTKGYLRRIPDTITNLEIATMYNVRKFNWTINPKCKIERLRIYGYNLYTRTIRAICEFPLTHLILHHCQITDWHIPHIRKCKLHTLGLGMNRLTATGIDELIKLKLRKFTCNSLNV